MMILEEKESSWHTETSIIDNSIGLFEHVQRTNQVQNHWFWFMTQQFDDAKEPQIVQIERMWRMRYLNGNERERAEWWMGSSSRLSLPRQCEKEESRRDTSWWNSPVCFPRVERSSVSVSLPGCHWSDEVVDRYHETNADEYRSYYSNDRNNVLSRLRSACSTVLGMPAFESVDWVSTIYYIAVRIGCFSRSALRHTLDFLSCLNDRPCWWSSLKANLKKNQT